MDKKIKKQWLKKVMILGLVILMMFGNTLSVMAAEPAEVSSEISNNPVGANVNIGSYSSEGKATRNTVIRTCSASLGISGSTASCSGMGSAYASMASSVSLKMYLQRYGSSWTTVASWNTTANGTIATLNKTATIGSGTYRVKVVCTAGNESVTVYSTTKTK